MLFITTLSHAYQMSHTQILHRNAMASTGEERKVSIALPEIEDKPSLVQSNTASKVKKRRPSSSGSFPRTRRFSYESPEVLKQREKGFVLDGVTLSRQTNEEIERSQPSVNIGIPQYNALHDKHAQRYFKRKGLPKTVTSPEVDLLFYYYNLLFSFILCLSLSL